MTSYTYNGKTVYKIDGQNFGTYLNVKDVEGNIYTVRPIELTEVSPGPPASLPIRPLIPDKLSSTTSSSEDIPVKDKDKPKDKEIQLAQLETSLSLSTEPLLPINTFESSDISKLASSLPGIGRVTLTKLLTNRPETGYDSMQSVKDLNPGHFKWDELEKFISFE